MQDEIPSQVDYLITGGLILDGTGAPGFVADVAVTGDQIVAISPDLADKIAFGRQFDASGLVVSPGFIDIHTHSDLSVLGQHNMSSSIHQGVTTEMTGNCGFCAGLIDSSKSVFGQELGWLQRDGVKVDWNRMSGFLSRVESEGVSSNLATLVGHGTIRKAVLGFEQRSPNDTELSLMLDLTTKAMEDGVAGLSTGLEYIPGGYADLDEICALATVAKEAGGFYASHLRNEGDTLEESVEEAIAVGERTGIPVQLSHHKSEGKLNWGKVKNTLLRMQSARESGLDVLTDQYPYTAFMTGLTLILLPPWVRSGSPEEIIARLSDEAARIKIEAEIETAGLDYDLIQIGVARKRPEVQGLTLTQLGALERTTPARAAINLLISENGFVAAAHFAISEEDVELVLRDPHTMIGSDGVATAPGAPERPHPRSYGTFPRVLGRYVRDHSVLTLADAVYRMTSLPAKRMRLSDRGRIAVGMRADIVVFNPREIKDLATFEDPHQVPAGIDYVFVNGVLTVDHGHHTGARAGRVLRR